MDWDLHFKKTITSHNLVRGIFAFVLLHVAALQLPAQTEHVINLPKEGSEPF